MEITLSAIRKEVEDVAGKWNGDESGTQEEKAHCAVEIIDLLDRLEVLIEELNN